MTVEELLSGVPWSSIADTQITYQMFSKGTNLSIHKIMSDLWTPGVLESFQGCSASLELFDNSRPQKKKDAKTEVILIWRLLVCLLSF